MPTMITNLKQGKVLFIGEAELEVTRTPTGGPAIRITAPRRLPVRLKSKLEKDDPSLLAYLESNARSE